MLFAFRRAVNPLQPIPFSPSGIAGAFLTPPSAGGNAELLDRQEPIHFSPLQICEKAVGVKNRLEIFETISTSV